MGLDKWNALPGTIRITCRVRVEVGRLRKKKPSYKELGTLYFDLLDKKISEP
jgi:hypothetical protein